MDPKVPAPRARRVNHVGISVLNMDRSLLFYRDLLGLVVVLDLDVANNPGLERVVGMEAVIGRVVFLDAGEGRFELWEYSAPRGRPLRDGHRPADLGVSHVAFEIDDLDEVFATVTAAGMDVLSPPEDLGIHRTFYLRGPDGEFVELLEDRSDLAMLARVTARSHRRRVSP